MKINIFLFFCIIFFTSLKSWSYNANRVIENIHTNYGPILIYERNTEGIINRCITFKQFASGDQSCINIESPNVLMFEYYKMVMASLYIMPTPSNILIIGLGGGVLPQTYANLFPNAQIDIVDINDKMLLVAQKYFKFTETNNMKVHINDAAYFITQAKDKIYDIIIVDAFNKDYIPDNLLTEDFFQDIKNKLTDKGVVAVNTFADGKRNKENRLMREIFGDWYDLYTHPKSGNRVILASAKTLPSAEEIKENSIGWDFYFKNLGIDTDWLLKTIHLNK